MAGWTLEEVGNSEEITRDTVSKFCLKIATLQKLDKNQQTFATFADDFDPPIYNVWKVQNKSNKVNHFGNSEQQWLENLLYLYTEPFGMVAR